MGDCRRWRKRKRTKSKVAATSAQAAAIRDLVRTVALFFRRRSATGSSQASATATATAIFIAHLAALLRGTRASAVYGADKKVRSYSLISCLSLSINTGVLLPLFSLLIILYFSFAAPCPTTLPPPNAWVQPTAPRVKSPRPPSRRKSAMPMFTSYRRHRSLLLC
jgi:hypothetical protein